MKCPRCGFKLKPKEIAREFASIGGKSTSEAKAKAARENGKKGGKRKAD